MKLAAAIDVPPATYLKTVWTQKDVKSLLNDHRLLHSWFAELQAPTPRITIGKGWTAQLIKAAHDSVIKRIKQLKPDFVHNSPMGAAKSTIGEMVMLVPDYVSLTGSRAEGADKDIVVRDDEDESLTVRLTQLLGENAHIIFNPKGPHDEDCQSLYHLVLIPVELYEVSKGGRRAPITAAMETYRGHLRGFLTAARFRKRIVLGASLIREGLIGCGAAEAVDVGREAAEWVLSGLPFPSVEANVKDILTAAEWDEDELYLEARRIFKQMMVPIDDVDAYTEGLRKIEKQILRWKKKNPFDNKDEALDAARELAVSVAKKIKEKS